MTHQSEKHKKSDGPEFVKTMNTRFELVQDFVKEKAVFSPAMEERLNGIFAVVIVFLEFSAKS